MKKAKNFCAILFCMIFILTGLPALALSAEAAPTVTMTKTVDYKNGTVTIDVYIDKAEYTDAYTLNIEYDALSFKDCAADNEDDLVACNSGTQGILKIGIIRMIKEPTLNAKIISLTFLLNSGYYGFVQSGEVRLTGTAVTNDYNNGVELTPQTITVDLHCPHANTEITPENPATCDTYGDSERIVCKDCKQTVKESTLIKPLGHSWDNGTADRNGDIVYTCTRCGKPKTGAPCLTLKPTVNGDTVSVDIVVKNDSAENIYSAVIDFDKTELKYKDSFFSDEYLSTLDERYKKIWLIHDLNMNGNVAISFATKTALKDGTVIATVMFDRIGNSPSTTVRFADGSMVSTALYEGFNITGTATIELKAIIRGDVDGDGSVSVRDARLALRAAVKLETLIGDALAAADVDGIEGVSVADARLILRCAVKLQTL